ncbi:hypothetical protein ABZ569_33505 [Streptomyces albus]|uniref:hypothetical protein n=1 Tax=Streptomyces albus TaxID=1888 RepID=UPI0033CCB075
MDTIVAGQRIVTEAEVLEAALGYDLDPIDIEAEFTGGGLASRDALMSLLDDLQVENWVDLEDAVFYRALLRRLPVELRKRRPAVSARVTVAELEADDDALGYEDEDEDLTAGWTGADYDSYEVLAALGMPGPATAVARAREPRAERRAVRAGLRLVRTEALAGEGEVAA